MNELVVLRVCNKAMKWRIKPCSHSDPTLCHSWYTSDAWSKKIASGRRIWNVAPDVWFWNIRHNISIFRQTQDFKIMRQTQDFKIMHQTLFPVTMHQTCSTSPARYFSLSLTLLFFVKNGCTFLVIKTYRGGGALLFAAPPISISQ